MTPDSLVLLDGGAKNCEFLPLQLTLDRVLPVGCWTPGFIAGPPADGQEPRRHSFGEILRPGRPERRKTVKPFEDAHCHRVLEDPGRLIGCHGLQVRLLSTRRGPVQSENLKGVTSGTGPGYTMVIKLSCRMSCRPSVPCLHLCVVGCWRDRQDGGARLLHVRYKRIQMYGSISTGKLPSHQRDPMEGDCLTEPSASWACQGGGAPNPAA